MIIDIPTSSDFEQGANSLLNLAWSTASEVMGLLEGTDIENWDNDGSVQTEFWRRAQPQLKAAISLIQQAFELALKGRISEKSPFLLISRNPRDWPSECDKGDLSFSEFRTIDATDLVKVHNTTCDPKFRLNDRFKTFFHELRRNRNVLQHTIDINNRVECISIFKTVLEGFQLLWPEKHWGTVRSEYLEHSPISIATGVYAERYLQGDLIFEFEKIINLLNDLETRKFFRFEKKWKRYICPECLSFRGKHPDMRPMAQLESNTESSTNLYCCVCNGLTQITRGPCTDPLCCGDVHWKNSENRMQCLTCSLEA